MRWRVPTPIPAVMELDWAGHRSGVRPGDKQLLVEIGCSLSDGAQLRLRLLTSDRCAAA